MNSRSNATPHMPGSRGESIGAATATPHARRPRRAGRGAGPNFQPSTCPRCSEITLHGLVAEGYLAHLDPTPLDDASEARALVAGRVTWHMTTDREVTWRTSTKIAYRPAGNHRDYAVFAEHRCHQPIATSIDDWAWSRPLTTTPEEPQF